MNTTISQKTIQAISIILTNKKQQQFPEHSHHRHIQRK